MGDPLHLVTLVVGGWLLTGLTLAVASVPLSRLKSPRAAWTAWAIVVLPVWGWCAVYILRNPLPLPLGPVYHIVLLSLLTVVPTAGAVWTGVVRARRDPPGPIFVDILLSAFTYVSMMIIGFIAGIIPDLMTVIGA